MPGFLLAGHQRGLAKVVAEAVETARASGRLRGWETRLVHSRLQNQSILEASQVEAVLQQAQDLDGAHVFGVSVDRERGNVERQIKPYFRFRWINPNAVAVTGQRDFEPLIAELERAILEDEVWIASVKPKSTSSPLALPGGLFKAKGDLASLWMRCEAYGDVGAIRATGALVDKFTVAYRRAIDTKKNEKTPWLDHDDWVWKDDGEEHGAAPFPKNWKYSWAVPEKFHFDVMPKNARAKTHFVDIHGTSHKLPKDSKYMNVTVHGEVRGYKSS